MGWARQTTGPLARGRTGDAYSNEREIRNTSNQLYTDIMRELVMRENGHDYGMAAKQSATLDA